MKELEQLHLAALLHDIGKFRMRATDRYKPHQEHSYEFVDQDFADFFAPCGDTFKNAIRRHHALRTSQHGSATDVPQDQLHLVDKQVILADRLSATEREDEERESEDFVSSALVSSLSRLKDATKDHRYPLTKLNLDRDTVIPVESPDIDQAAYAALWEEFTAAFRKATQGTQYTPAAYQTLVALLHRYTSRMPSATPWGQREQKTVPDISLYDHLRTTAAIAACIGKELSETEVDTQLSEAKDPNKRIGALIKGDISGIQDFLYQILSDGAANQLRGRSFYLQLLTESIAHYVLKQFDLPITNLILASGGHFYILAPYTQAKTQLDTIRQHISEKLWELHRGDLACILAGIAIQARDFGPERFPKKWTNVSTEVQQRKQTKWSELEIDYMFQNLFEPIPNDEPNDPNAEDPWKFQELGKTLRDAKYLITYDTAAADVPTHPTWHDAIETFGSTVHICPETNQAPAPPPHATRATVYRLGDTDFLTDTPDQTQRGTNREQPSENIPISYDFRLFKPVIARQHDTDDPEKVADYDYLAEAAAGVHWLGALRMDVDNLGKIFSQEQLENATISRLATLSEAFRLFFEGYVPQLCRAYNTRQEKQILELIYAGGDDLFLVGGWSALPDIAGRIRNEFRRFTTGDHVTLSGGISIEHKKFPLYQFADVSGDAEKVSKNQAGKNAITFLRKPMVWPDFERVQDWHHKFIAAMQADSHPLPHGLLTRLNQIYADKERWAWRSLYYFHRLQAKYGSQTGFLQELQHELNLETSFEFREFIHIITRWTALRLRKQED